jgi:hypothetical protein
MARREKNKTVVGDLDGATATADKLGQAIVVYIRDEGLFILSLTPVEGAVKADVKPSRISFADGAHAYTFITGAPVTRDGHIWVLHNAGFKLSQESASKFFITSLELDKLPSEWTSPAP